MRKHDALCSPVEGRCVVIECSSLPGRISSGTIYSFTIDYRCGAIVVHIPGHHRSPDDCTPRIAEQEIWLNGLTDLMHRSWGCEWDIHDETALGIFITMLEPSLQRYRFAIR